MATNNSNNKYPGAFILYAVGGSPDNGERFFKFYSFMSTSETNTQIIAPFDMIIDNLSVIVGGTTSSDACTISLRVNGMNTTLATTIPAATPGIYLDTLNEVVVLAGDLINLHKTSFTSGTLYPYSQIMVRCRRT